MEKREPLKAVYAHALSEKPEEDAWKKIQIWAGQKGLLTKEKETRVFGRNTYPTDNPEPHGYELYITIDETSEVDDEIIACEIPGGLYAVLKSTSLMGMAHAWPSLWRWLDESKYKFVGWRKNEHGWVNGYEEYLNPFNDKTPDEWLFNLMIPVLLK